MYEAYAAVAPRVEDWNTLGDKTGDMLRQDYDWTAEAARITAPVLLVFGDADMVTYEHIAEMLRAFGGAKGDPGWGNENGRGTAQLAILPGRNHYDVWMTPKLAQAVVPFLEAEL
jgi:pimeloyl-ACP methyl ester carboxylesterase